MGSWYKENKIILKCKRKGTVIMKKMNWAKIMKVCAATAVCTGAFTLSAFAGNWVKDATGWWYDYGNGTWPSNSWQWIDGNNDGVAECYYFDRFGYCLMNTTSPDGYQVNGSGAWVENGAVQTRNVAGTQVNNAGQSVAQNTSSKKSGLTLFNTEPILRGGAWKQDSAVSNRENKSYTKAIVFDNDDYIEFDNSAGYTHFKATVFPRKGDWGRDDRMLLQVLSGDEDEFYVTDDIYYDTRAFDIDVDISGYDKVRLKSTSVSGTYAEIAIANARFE